MNDFEVAVHREFIHRRGESIRWYRSMPCACLDVMGGTHDRQCSICGGIGYRYERQNPTSDKALVRQVDEERQFRSYGQLQVGNITITTMPDELPIGEGDLIDLVERRFRHSEVINHTGLTDAVHWQPVVELIEVRSLTKTYAIGDDEGQVGIAEDGGGIIWHCEEGAPVLPPAGERLTVVYGWCPRYIVMPGMVTTRRSVGGTSMPQRVAAKLWNRDEVKQ